MVRLAAGRHGVGAALRRGELVPHHVEVGVGTELAHVADAGIIEILGRTNTAERRVAGLDRNGLGAAEARTATATTAATLVSDREGASAESGRGVGAEADQDGLARGRRERHQAGEVRAAGAVIVAGDEVAAAAIKHVDTGIERRQAARAGGEVARRRSGEGKPDVVVEGRTEGAAGRIRGVVAVGGRTVRVERMVTEADRLRIGAVVVGWRITTAAAAADRALGHRRIGAELVPLRVAAEGIASADQRAALDVDAAAGRASHAAVATSAAAAATTTAAATVAVTLHRAVATVKAELLAVQADRNATEGEGAVVAVAVCHPVLRGAVAVAILDLAGRAGTRRRGDDQLGRSCGAVVATDQDGVGHASGAFEHEARGERRASSAVIVASDLRAARVRAAVEHFDAGVERSRSAAGLERPEASRGRGEGEEDFLREGCAIEAAAGDAPVGVRKGVVEEVRAFNGHRRVSAGVVGRGSRVARHAANLQGVVVRDRSAAGEALEHARERHDVVGAGGHADRGGARAGSGGRTAHDATARRVNDGREAGDVGVDLEADLGRLSHREFVPVRVARAAGGPEGAADFGAEDGGVIGAAVAATVEVFAAEFDFGAGAGRNRAVGGAAIAAVIAELLAVQEDGDAVVGVGAVIAVAVANPSLGAAVTVAVGDFAGRTLGHGGTRRGQQGRRSGEHAEVEALHRSGLLRIQY